MQSLKVTRYVQPLREGGSLPAIVEADNEGLYVMKFHGAGQGKKALIAEIIAGELARAFGLPMPTLAFLELDAKFGINEPHQEIQDLLNASVGKNIGVDYLPGSITFDGLVPGALTPKLASEIVWFDSLILNVDRTARNPNLLSWHKKLWLIDHGASLYFHHGWSTPADSAKSPFKQIKDHVLLPFASQLEQVSFQISRAQLDAVLALIPTEWLENEPGFADAEAVRRAYLDFIEARMAHRDVFVKEAVRARSERV